MANKSNLIIDQGATFSTVVTINGADGNPLNMTGYTANAELRRWYTSTNSTSFVTSINATAGSVTLSMDANTTGALTPYRYVYDVIVTDPLGTVLRVVEGIVTVTPDVTR